MGAASGTSGGQVSDLREESGIGISDFLRTRNSRHFKSRTLEEIGTVNFRGHVVEICAIGENPDKESIHRHLEFIGISGIQVTSDLCTLKSRSMKLRSVGDNC